MSVFLPWTRHCEYMKEFKQAHRRDDDIALINAGMQVFLAEKNETWAVVEASLGYGGIAPVPISAMKSVAFLKGKPWTHQTLQAEDTFCRLFPDSNKSAVDPYKRPTSYGVQHYEISQKGTVVDLPVVHLSAKLQVTGEAEYADDTPMPPNGLHAALVLSKKPHAQICFVDDSATKDIPGFEEFVTCVGQVIGIVVADACENAKIASQNIQVEYEELLTVLRINDALQVGSFHPNTEKLLQKGDVWSM
eukprot:Gb_12324 [translate_table: standard]